MYTSEPLHCPLSSSITWLTVSTREIVSPGPDLAGLGSVADDLPTDATHSKTWPGYMQAIQEQAPRFPSSLGYPVPQMNQYQDANITDHQLHIVRDDEGQLPRATVQMASASPTDVTAPIQLENSQPQQREEQGPGDDHESGSEGQSIEPEYFSNGPTNGNGLRDEQVPPAPEVEMQMSDSQDSGDSPDGTALTAGDDDNSVSLSSQSDSEDAQVFPSRLEKSETLDAVSVATVTAPSARDQHALDEAANTTLAEHTTRPELSLEMSSTANERSQVSEWIKALENQGALADLLKELGYQKPRQPGRRLLTTRSVHSVASDSSRVMCDEPNCGKTFSRPCELK
jgi:hypothetical protein